MGLSHRFLQRFSVYDMVIISMMAAIGIAIKPVIVPLVHIISGPLMIPGGVLAGGFYMMWLVLGVSLTHKIGTATLIGLVQAIAVIATGMLGSHGIFSLITYTVPGFLADLGLLLTGHRVCCIPCAFMAGMLANIGGALMVNMVYFRLPLLPLLLTLATGALSGGLGGILAFLISKQITKLKYA